METDVGQVRSRNEDCVFCDEALGVAVVADGMGGHAGGQVAARLAVDALVAHLRACVTEGGVRERDIEVAVAEANRAVFAMASSKSRRSMSNRSHSPGSSLLRETEIGRVCGESASNAARVISSEGGNGSERSPSSARTAYVSRPPMRTCISAR